MHEHDQDIIMALAEGSLDPEAMARAEAAISACDECRTELELQRLALTTLQAAPAVYLSASESARLHDRLHRELRVTPPAPARPRLRPAWGRWATLAAGTAAVFLAAFLVLPSIFGGDDDADTVAFEEMADESRTATTAAAAEAPSAAIPSDDADMGAALQESAPTTTVAAPETTAAAAETTAAPDLAGDGAGLPYFVVGELTEELRLQVIEQLTLNGGAFVEFDAAAKRTEPDWAACVTTLFGPDSMADGVTPQIVGSIVDDLGIERLLVVLVNEADPADTIVISVTLPECEVFEFLPESEL